jgi:hypothetical protein
MGLILFILIAPVLAIVIATYLLTKGDVIPPYQPKVEDHWPFPNKPKP